MHIYLLGICGTFMASLASLAKQKGFKVSGWDKAVYPPMSDFLREQGISLSEQTSPEALPKDIDLFVIGNALSRGHPLVEHILNERLPYQSGPGFLAQHILPGRRVIAVAGTHGKTTTTTLLVTLLEQAGLNPGYLIGGIPRGLKGPSELGQDWFVLEADEYDSAFFDKRPKFMHYRPEQLIINNLEFDHADIYRDLASIAEQFRYLLRTVPANGLVVSNAGDKNSNELLADAIWSRRQTFAAKDANWQAKLTQADGSQFQLIHDGQCLADVQWSQLGEHNVANALAACAVAKDCGLSNQQLLDGLRSFAGVKRRLEKRGEINGISIYDDFAHHPTAIKTTLQALKQHQKSGRLILILELGSYTMREGVHSTASMQEAVAKADQLFLAQPKNHQASQFANQANTFANSAALIDAVANQVKSGDYILVMSNTGFDNLLEKLPEALAQK